MVLIHLICGGLQDGLALLNERGERLPIHHWSSGLADQAVSRVAFGTSKGLFVPSGCIANHIR